MVKIRHVMLLLIVVSLVAFFILRGMPGGESTDPGANVAADAQNQPQASNGGASEAKGKEAPVLNAPLTDEMRKSPLQKKDIVVGAGKQAGQDSKVSFHIVMKQMNGTVAFDSRKDGRPWTGVIGDGSLITGIDMGIRGMFVGGKRSLWIPPHLAYGANGIPGQVPPNAQVYAEIEILSIF